MYPVDPVDWVQRIGASFRFRVLSSADKASKRDESSEFEQLASKAVVDDDAIPSYKNSGSMDTYVAAFACARKTKRSKGIYAFKCGLHKS